MTLQETFQKVRGNGKRTVARLARRVLPPTMLTLVHVEPGLNLTVNLRRHVMFWTGGLARFEPCAVRALRAAVEPGDTVFDVGANIGFFSTLFSRWVGAGGRVIALEPEPENLGLLRRNLDRNRCANVTVHAAAAGALPGTAHFSIDRATGATGHLGQEPTTGELSLGSGRVRLIETKVETIDALVERLDAPPRVIKLDIEGGEIHALEGAARTLADHRPIVVSELNGATGPDAVELLVRAGYRLWDLESGQTIDQGGHPFMVLAIPAESVDDARGLRIQKALPRPR